MKLKKIIGLLMVIAVGLSILSGCTKEKTVVLDTNVKENGNVVGDFKEETIDVKMEDEVQYTPIYFEGNDIYGNIAKTAGGIVDKGTEEYPIFGVFKGNQYILNNDGSFKETDRAVAMHMFCNGDYKQGLATNPFGEEQDMNVYYFNNKTSERRIVGTIKQKPEAKIEQRIGLVEGNKDFGYIMEFQGKVDNVGEEKILNIELINVRDNKTYVCKNIDFPLMNTIVYSKTTEKFYAVDWQGNVYTIALENEEAKIKKVDKIDIKDLYSIFTSQISINNNGEIVIMNGHVGQENLAIIYNTKTKKTNYISKAKEENTEIVKYFPEGNKVIIGKGEGNQDLFVGELKDDFIKVYTKLDIKNKDGEYSRFANAAISDDGSKIIVGKVLYTIVDNTMANCRYEYKVLTFN